MSITESFSKATSQTSKAFTIVHFKRLLLDFIVNNNISFRAITTSSFKKLLNYQNNKWFLYLLDIKLCIFLILICNLHDQCKLVNPLKIILMVFAIFLIFGLYLKII